MFLRWLVKQIALVVNVPRTRRVKGKLKKSSCIKVQWFTLLQLNSLLYWCINKLIRHTFNENDFYRIRDLVVDRRFSMQLHHSKLRNEKWRKRNIHYSSSMLKIPDQGFPRIWKYWNLTNAFKFRTITENLNNRGRQYARAHN